MKKCPKCGNLQEDAAATCTHCGEPFPFGGRVGHDRIGMTDETRVLGEASWTRPTGGATIRSGTILMILAMVVAFFGGFDAPDHYLALAWISGGAFQLGFILFCLGQIQKALWFLPGREIGSD